MHAVYEKHFLKKYMFSLNCKKSVFLLKYVIQISVANLVTLHPK